MTVKAYLIGKEDCNKEIRRFAVDQDVSTSFEYLKRKVLDVFVGLRTAPFQMYYKGKSKLNSEIEKKNNVELLLEQMRVYVVFQCVSKNDGLF